MRSTWDEGVTAKDRLVADRMRRSRPPQRGGQWLAKAKAFAREHGLVESGVLDMHDHLADLLEWEGASRSHAEFFAWEQTVEMLTPRRVA